MKVLEVVEYLRVGEAGLLVDGGELFACGYHVAREVVCGGVAFREAAVRVDVLEDAFGYVPRVGVECGFVCDEEVECADFLVAVVHVVAAAVGCDVSA